MVLGVLLRNSALLPASIVINILEMCSLHCWFCVCRFCFSFNCFLHRQHFHANSRWSTSNATKRFCSHVDLHISNICHHKTASQLEYRMQVKFLVKNYQKQNIECLTSFRQTVEANFQSVSFHKHAKSLLLPMVKTQPHRIKCLKRVQQKPSEWVWTGLNTTKLLRCIRETGAKTVYKRTIGQWQLQLNCKG